MTRAWIRPVARVGFTAKGIVYATIGVLAAKSAAGLGGGRTTDTEGALRTLGRQPHGDVFLVGIGLGLVAYAAWRTVQAVLDVDGKGRDAKGLVVRASFLGSGLVHLGLAATALALFTGARRRAPSEGIEHWTARALAEPYGVWAVGAVGAGVLIAGLYQLYKAHGARFEKRLALEGLGADRRRWIRRIGQSGLIARGITFGIIGWFLFQAARHVDPSQARGLAGSLRVLRQQPFGDVLLGAVGVGFVAYGLHSLVMARYRRLPR
jgi:hypothetical protein